MKCKENYPQIQFETFKAHLHEAIEKNLSQELDSDTCRQLVNEHCWSFQKNTLYNPLTTLVTFIKQVLSSDKSCKNAVTGLLANEIAANGQAISQSTGSYVKARQRLPLELIRSLVKMTGEALLKQSPSEWKPYGRHLKGFDGTTLTMPETKENEEQFPKHSNQSNHIGFPILRLVVVISLTLGTLIDYAVGACKGKGTGEVSLLRRILSCIEPNDICLGDRYYPHFFFLCNLKARGADGVFRAAAQRRYDFRRGKRLGSQDHIAIWIKPKRPDWMSKEEYQNYPDSIEVREFKKSGLIYVTTLLDSKLYIKEELCLLYKRRWEVETHLHYIKTIMDMSHLSCKTPLMIEKEIAVHFLAYNLIRSLMVKASIKHQLAPAQISFKSTIQLLHHFTPLIAHVKLENRPVLFEVFLDCIAQNKVANRPGRTEPRAVKRKPKTFPVLREGRKSKQKKLHSLQAQAILLTNSINRLNKTSIETQRDSVLASIL